MEFVRTKGHQLTVGGRPFYFSGTNCYYLLTRSADEGTRAQVLAVLDAAVALHVTVIRTWAFNDGEEQWNAMQPACGQYSEKVLHGLDWLLCECLQRGLRLLLALTNYWPEFGGMQQYVRWCEAAAEQQAAEQFYNSTACQAAYRRYISTLVTRVSTITGVAYRDCPVILGWELANEPRCEGNLDGQTINGWVALTAAYLRNIDPNHLIGVGSEGFFGVSTPELWPCNPYGGSEQHGVDFVAQHASPHIDFASFHAYPDHWGHGCSKALKPGQQQQQEEQQEQQQQQQLRLMAAVGADGADGEDQQQQQQHLAEAVGPELQQLQLEGAVGAAGVAQQPLHLGGPACSAGAGSGSGSGLSGSGSGPGDECRMACRFLKTYIESHMQACQTLIGKPLILSEYGMYRCTCGVQGANVLPRVAKAGHLAATAAAAAAAAGVGAGSGSQAATQQSACRDACFDLVLRQLLHSAHSGGPLAGVAFWMLADPLYPDYDGFTLVGEQGTLVAEQGKQHTLVGAQPSEARVTLRDEQQQQQQQGEGQLPEGPEEDVCAMPLVPGTAGLIKMYSKQLNCI